MSVTVSGSRTEVGETDNVISAYTIKRAGVDVDANYTVTIVNGKLTVIFPYAGGAGTEGNPYQIATKTQLEYVRDRVNADANYSTGLYFKQTANINLGGANWTPIGNLTYQFKGTFDGADKTISGLVVINDGTEYRGLFGYIGSGGVVKNVKLENVDIKGMNYVGGIAGRSSGTITNCIVSGNVTGSADIIGGIAGDSYGGNMENCHFISGTVESTRDSTTSDYSRVGGIVGWNRGSAIKWCSNAADVIGSRGRVGGIVGDNNQSSSQVIECFNTGNVSSNATDVVGFGNFVGGVAGNNSGTIKSSYAWGDVTGTGGHVGGVAGYSNNLVTDSYHANGTITGKENIGGVAGYNYNGTVSNTVSVSGTEVVGNGAAATNSYAITGDRPDYFWWSFNVGGDFSDIDIWTWDSGESLPVLKALNPDLTISGIGKGTADDPYLISSRADLAALATQVNTVADFTVGKHFKQTANINLGGSASPWSPIGINSLTCCFKGVYDGNGYTVSGLYINSTKDKQGLFGTIIGGTVKNLAVVGEVTSTDGAEVGGIAGRIESGAVISNCSFSGTVAGSYSIGGIVGSIYSASTIEDCYVAAGSTVSGTGSIGNVGGIIGRHNGGSWAVRRCGSLADVSGTTNVGGIAGSSIGIIENCYAWGNITATGSNVGGVVGNNSRSVTYSYHAAGTVKGAGAVGGIVGLSATNGAMMYCAALADSVIATPASGNANKVVGLVSGGADGSNCYTYAEMPVTGNTSGGNKGSDGLPKGMWQAWSTFTIQLQLDSGIWAWDSGAGLPVLIGVS